MNIDYIRQLAEIMKLSGIHSIDLSGEDGNIRLERETASNPVLQVPNEQVPVLAPKQPASLDSDEVVDFNKVREIKSPMVGLFYPAAAPGKAPFVQKGDKIKKGDVLCIIEAMKMMNEIVAEEDATLLDVCVGEGQLVEFSQVLFKIL